MKNLRKKLKNWNIFLQKGGRGRRGAKASLENSVSANKDWFRSVLEISPWNLEVEVMVGHLSGGLLKLETPTSLLHPLPPPPLFSQTNLEGNPGHFSVERYWGQKISITDVLIDTGVLQLSWCLNILTHVGWGHNQLTDKCNRKISRGATATAK